MALAAVWPAGFLVEKALRVQTRLVAYRWALLLSLREEETGRWAVSSGNTRESRRLLLSRGVLR